LSEKYDEIMNKIEVTEDMRSRVMENVRKADLTRKHTVIRFPNIRRYTALAACLAVVLIGVMVGPKLFQQAQPPVENVGGIVECVSPEELSKAVGFPVSDVTTLPFDIAETAYVSNWGKVAEIDYTGSDGQSAVYRKSVGTDDNSGDSSTYDSTQDIMVGSMTAELKGNGKSYTMACWTDGTYAYSLNLSSGVDAAMWSTVIDGIN